MRSTYTWIYNIAVGVVGIYLLTVFQRGVREGFQAVKSSPLFTDAYVITMDKYPERFPRIRGNAEAAGIELKKWPGVEVKEDEVLSLPAKGVGTLIYTARAGGQKRNLGAIGCFLAHRGLLEHISANPVGLGTLICEDDVLFPPDFYAKLAAVASEIPEDWDYIFMNKFKIDGKPISKNIMKLEQDLSSSKNMGTWAFIVKNASIQSKILPILSNMTDEIDLQLSRNADVLNTYLITPPIIYLHETADKSIISKMDEEAKSREVV
jgi:GR25 family glycosyltransferase involved in LPS biosynthesis